MKQSRTNRHYQLPDGTVVYFHRKHCKDAVLARQKRFRCSQQEVLEELSEDTGISTGAIRHWCAGHHAPSDLEKIYDMAKALDVDALALLEADALDSMPAADIWTAVVNKLSAELPPLAMHTWFSGCRPLCFAGNCLEISAGSEFRRDILLTRYNKKIENALRKLYSRRIKLSILAD